MSSDGTIESNYSDKDQAYYEQVTLEQQVLHNTRNYLTLGQMAFRTCVHSFLHSELTEREKKCVSSVSLKYIASALRSTSRLAEAQALVLKREREDLEKKVTVGEKKLS